MLVLLKQNLPLNVSVLRQQTVWKVCLQINDSGYLFLKIPQCTEALFVQ